ncbi:MAG: class I SAM-dependent methyltransferase [Burkholderiales bacterium]|nr:class I SAM-dependent methyltransferase [Burkholderiales bacterium]
MEQSDSVFAGSIPELYDRYLVPLIFEPYARDLTARVMQRKPATVLEIAAGTGVVTRELAATLPASTIIVASDLNQPMLDQAAAIGTARPIDWRQADAMQLPFEDRSFDVVACQFGVMFFPDKARAFSEARRVLRPGGVFLFNVWDSIEENDFIRAVAAAHDTLFPDAPPRFMQRGPHGYADTTLIAQDLARGGFERRPEITTLPARSRAESPRHPAIGYCQGSPLRMELESKGPGMLEKATDAAAEAIARKFGAGRVEGAIQAHVVVAER